MVGLKRLDWTIADIGILSGIFLAWGSVFTAIAMKVVEARISNRLEPVYERLRVIELSLASASTALDILLSMSKQAMVKQGLADRNSPYKLRLDDLGAMIEKSGYVPAPEMLDAFRELVARDELPENDGDLFMLIEQQFGMKALLDEGNRFGASPDLVPAIWTMCIRKAREIGADELLRQIRVIR
jgi:hypothetical protein